MVNPSILSRISAENYSKPHRSLFLATGFNTDVLKPKNKSDLEM
jgi:hypothetical protein